MQRIWSHFIALDSARNSNGYSCNPISFTEMRNYFDLLGEDVERWEIQLLNKLDRALLEIYAKQAEKEVNKVKK